MNKQNGLRRTLLHFIYLLKEPTNAPISHTNGQYLQFKDLRRLWSYFYDLFYALLLQTFKIETVRQLNQILMRSFVYKTVKRCCEALIFQNRIISVFKNSWKSFLKAWSEYRSLGSLFLQPVIACSVLMCVCFVLYFFRSCIHGPLLKSFLIKEDKEQTPGNYCDS